MTQQKRARRAKVHLPQWNSPLEHVSA